MRYTLIALLSTVFAIAGQALAEPVTVAAAISLKETMADAGKAFEAASGNHVDFIFGASGQLAAQIKNGAPVDLFVSAAQKQVDDVVAAGLTTGKPRVVAANDLVLIVPADAAGGPSSFKDLASPAVVKIAIGDPKSVPAGQYAMEVLTYLKLADALRPRLIYGLNVRQVLTYVERSEVSAGIVYSTDAKEAGAKVKIVAIAEPQTHQPIVYPAVAIKSGAHAKAAEQFLDFLASAKGQTILENHGFKPANDAPQAGPR